MRCLILKVPLPSGNVHYLFIILSYGNLVEIPRGKGQRSARLKAGHAFRLRLQQPCDHTSYLLALGWSHL